MIFNFRGGYHPKRYNLTEGGRANVLTSRREEVGKGGDSRG